MANNNNGHDELSSSFLMSEIKEVKDDVKDLKKEMYTKFESVRNEFTKEINSIQISLTSINTKLMLASFVVSTIVVLVVNYLGDIILKR